MGKKNASLLILSGFIFIYFISLIYIPSNLFNLNATEYRVKFNKLFGEEYFDFSGGEGGRKFNSLRCSNWNKCTMLDVVMKRDDQHELGGREVEPEFYIEQLKLSPAQNSLITQNKLKLTGIPYKIVKLDSSPNLPHGIDIILSYTINNNDQEINYGLTTVEGSEVKFFKITGGLKVEDIFLTSESLLITRWGSNYEFEYYKLDNLLSLPNNTKLKFKLGPKKHKINDNINNSDKLIICNYFNSPKRNSTNLQSIIKLELKQNIEFSLILYRFVKFTQLQSSSWTSNIIHTASLPNPNYPQSILRNRPHTNQYGLYTIRTSHNHPYSAGIGKISSFKLKLPEKPIYVRSEDVGVVLVNNGDGELIISNLDFKIEKLMPFENQGPEFIFKSSGVFNNHKADKVEDDESIIQLAPRLMSASNWNTIIDPYYDDDEDDDPYSTSYSSASSESMEESIKFAKLSKQGDKLILINNQNMIKLYEKKQIMFSERTDVKGEEIRNPKKIINWLLVREFRVSNIVNDIKGLDLIESVNYGSSDIDNIVLLDSQNKLFFFNPSLTKTNSTSNNFRKSSFFLERPLLVTCMTIIVLSFSYVEYLQVD